VTQVDIYALGGRKSNVRNTSTSKYNLANTYNVIHMVETKCDIFTPVAFVIYLLVIGERA
jgi:hypothetical protein